MTSEEVPHSSPWLSVWLRPRKTIERIVAADPRRHVLLLAALGGIGTIFLMGSPPGAATGLMDWRPIASVAIVGAAFGVVSLYINGLAYKWSGRMLGGRASSVDVRAAFAWAGMPNIIGLAICLVVLMGLKLVVMSKPTSGALIVVLQWITAVLVLWSWVATILMLGRVHGFGFWRAIVIYGVGMLFVWLLVLPFKTFVFQPFHMPSGSLKPTLVVGDYFFVSKFSYGYSRYSLPFSPPLFSGRIFAPEPQRGDVVVFRLPRDDTVDWIKRIVGLPGDRIQMIKGQLHINGDPVKRERIEDFIDTEEGPTTRIKRWRETLPNGASYMTLDQAEDGFYDNTKVYEVPPGHYFMMGDHRDNSIDSRDESRMGVGTVPRENLVGRAQIIFFSVDWGNRNRIRFDRFGLVIR